MSAPRVLQGRCPPYGEGITYWPLVEILRSLLNVEDGESKEGLRQRLNEFVQDILAQTKSNEDATEIANALIRSIGSGLDGDSSEPSFNERREIQRSTYSKSTEQGGTHAVLLRAWRVFLEAIAQQEPLILVIDDLQWADEALLDLLEYLTDRIDDVPILFLCPARPDFYERRRDWGDRRSVRSLPLADVADGDRAFPRRRGPDRHHRHRLRHARQRLQRGDHLAMERSGPYRRVPRLVPGNLCGAQALLRTAALRELPGQ